MTDWLADFDDLTRVVAADGSRAERARTELGEGDRVVGTIARRRPRPVVLTGSEGAWVLNGRALPRGATCRSRGALVHAVTARAGGRRVARAVYLDYVTGRRGGALHELVDFAWRPDEDFDVGAAVAMTVNGEVRPPWRWAWNWGTGPCPDCDGGGRVAYGSEDIACGRCGGDGTVPVARERQSP